MFMYTKQYHIYDKCLSSCYNSREKLEYKENVR